MTLPTIGSAAPDLELATDGNGRIRLSELRPDKVVLYFYPKDDTSGCTSEAKDFSRLRAEFEAAGTTVVGISPDSVASHDKFKKKYSLELTLASDENRSTLE